MSHQLYNTMQPLGQMHAAEIARAVDALCQQACTHAAMAGALVARGMTPSDAFHTVLAWEGAGMTIPTRMMVPTMQSIPVAQAHMVGHPGARQMMAPGMTGTMAPGMMGTMAPGMMGTGRSDTM